jgi:polysaccharide export outer membrane protein
LSNGPENGLLNSAPTPGATVDNKGEPTPAATANKKGEKPSGATADLVQVADTFTSVGTPGNSAYKIGPLDVLDISVFKVPELSHTVQVSGVGTINLPLVGELPAAGKTARDIERDLTAKLGAKYLQSPQVTVYIKEYNSQRVTIEGAIKKPGVYPMRGKTTLLQLVATAEGFNEVSDLSEIVVFRRVGSKRSAAKFDVSEIRAGRVDDPALQEGDVIVVNESAGKVAFQNVLKALPITSAFMMF